MGQSGTYQRFARYYDVYVGDFDADLPLYLSLCEPGNRILEVGCGTGRVLTAFLEAGYEIDGLDTSPEMLHIARQKLGAYLRSGRLRLHYGALDEVPFDQAVDRILVTWFTFNYLIEEREREEFLKRAFGMMAPGATIAMDLFYPRPMQRPETENRWHETSFEVDGRTVLLRQKRRMVGDVEERIQIYSEGESSEEILTRRRYVGKDQGVRLLEKMGFLEVRVVDGYDPSGRHVPRPDEATTGSFVVTARRP
jgi:ubiquinone/menaquinone biosynthesis C-methylase UbiE